MAGEDAALHVSGTDDDEDDDEEEEEEDVVGGRGGGGASLSMDGLLASVVAFAAAGLIDRVDEVALLLLPPVIFDTWEIDIAIGLIAGDTPPPTPPPIIGDEEMLDEGCSRDLMLFVKAARSAGLSVPGDAVAEELSLGAAWEGGSGARPVGAALKAMLGDDEEEEGLVADDSRRASEDAAAAAVGENADRAEANEAEVATVDDDDEEEEEDTETDREVAVVAVPGGASDKVALSDDICDETSG